MGSCYYRHNWHDLCTTPKPSGEMLCARTHSSTCDPKSHTQPSRRESRRKGFQSPSARKLLLPTTHELWTNTLQPITWGVTQTRTNRRQTHCQAAIFSNRSQGWQVWSIILRPRNSCMSAYHSVQGEREGRGREEGEYKVKERGTEKRRKGKGRRCRGRILAIRWSIRSSEEKWRGSKNRFLSSLVLRLSCYLLYRPDIWTLLSLVSRAEGPSECSKSSRRDGQVQCIRQQPLALLR